MVRGPAAVLTLCAAGAAYFLAAPALPELSPEDVSLLVACGLGVALVVGLAAAVVPAIDAPAPLVLVVLGAGLLTAALDAAHVGAGVTPMETLLWASVGVLFAALLRTPSLALALPIFVAALDLAGLAGGSAGDLVGRSVTAGDPLTLELPDWGTGLAAGRLAAAEVAFLGVFGAYAWTFGFRRRATIAGMFLGLLGAVASQVLLDTDVPALALMALGYFVPNLDRAAALVRRVAEG